MAFLGGLHRSILWGLLVVACGPSSDPFAELELPAGSEPVSEVVRRLAEADPGCQDAGTLDGAGRAPGRAEELLARAGEAFGGGELARAAELYREAAAELEGRGERCRAVEATIERCRALSRLERRDEAAREYALALGRAAEAGHREAAARILNNLGVLESERQRFRLALEHYAGARFLWRRLGDRYELALSHQNVGVCLFVLGRLETAEQVLAEAAGLFAALGEGRRRNLATSLTWLGRVRVARGRLEAAEEALERALELRRGPADAEGLAGTLDALGRAHLEAGRFAEAEDALWRAHDLLVGGGARELANLLGNLAELHQRSARPHAALWLSRRSLELLEREAIEDLNLLTHDLYVQARALHALSRVEAASALMERVVHLLELLRTADSGDLLMGFFASRRAFFDFYVELLVERGEAREAFDVAELARARGLLDQLIWRSAEVRARSGPELLARDEEVRSRLAAVGRELERAQWTGPSGDPPAETLEHRARGLRFELARLEAEMRARVGRGTSGRPVTLSEFQPSLASDTLLLVYQLAPERSVLWAVTRDALRCRADLPSRERLEAAARRFRLLVERGGSARRQAAAEGRELSRALLAPVADLLEGRRLVIVPDGALSELPFAALPSPPGTAGGPEQSLLARHPLAVAHSLSAVAAIRERGPERRAAQETLQVVVADPVYSRRDPRHPASGDPPAEDAGVPSWPRLVASAREAAAISRLASPGGCRVLEGLDASRPAVLAGALGGARYVHLAAHADLHPEHPELSFVALSAFDAEGRPADGQLRLQDLDRLDLSAELVVLSGCRTALGQGVVGEGPMAFPRGFLHAGAAAVVASLWKVEDEPTALLMEHFWGAVHRGRLPPIEALRRAQLRLAEGGPWRDPRHWAAFVLLGEWQG